MDLKEKKEKPRMAGTDKLQKVLPSIYQLIIRVSGTFCELPPIFWDTELG